MHRRPNAPSNELSYFFAGEVAGEETGLAAAGDAAGLFAAAAGELPGFAASADAGRMPPRVAGLESTFAANWFTIFASEMATVSKAALRISFR